MSQITLANFRTRALERADMANSQFIGVPELNAIVNEELAELYDVLVDRFVEWFFAQASFTLTGSSNIYALGVGVLDLRGLDRNTGGTNYQAVDMMRFADRNRKLPSRSGAPVRYMIQGENLVLYPPEQAAGDYIAYYVPVYTPLVADSDVSFDIPNGWEAMVYAGSAAKCLGKEESDASLQMSIKSSIMQRIIATSTNRDATGPSTITFSRSRSGVINPNTEPFDPSW